MTTEIETSRGSGRTHRMLVEAINMARGGKKIAVVAPSPESADVIKALARKIAENDKVGWAVDGNMHFLSAKQAVEREPGCYYAPGCSHTFVDHSTYTEHYQDVIDGWLATVRRP